MPISLKNLAAHIQPSKTVLVLGAGASIPSGAPSGAALAKILWEKIAKSEPKSEDLIETATLLSRNYSRKEVVDQIGFCLGHLQPTGGLLALPNYPWKSIFTTNFDQLVERGYKRNNLPLVVYQSNYDFTHKEQAEGTKFGLHPVRMTPA